FEGAAEWPGVKALVRPEYIEIGKLQEFRIPSATRTGKVKHIHFRGSEWMVEVEVGAITLITYRSLEKEVLQPGQEVQVLIHRAYMFHDADSWIMENPLKEDPMPIHI